MNLGKFLGRYTKIYHMIYKNFSHFFPYSQNVGLIFFTKNYIDFLSQSPVPSVVLESKLAKNRWWTNHRPWLILCIGIHYLRISVKFSHFRDLTDGTTCTFRDFFWCSTHFYHKICLFTEHCSTCFFHLLYTFYSRLLNLVREVGYSPLWNLRVLCGCWSCWGGMTL